MILRIGTPPSEWVGTLDERYGASLFSDDARRALFVEGELRLGWDFALFLRELRDDDSTEGVWNYGNVPSWADPDDLDVLCAIVDAAQLPKTNGFQLSLKAEGIAGRTGYRLVARWTEGQGRPLIPEPLVKDGLVEMAGAARRCLTFGQYRLLERLAEDHSFGNDRQKDLLGTADILSAVPLDDPGVSLDSFLRREIVTNVKRIVPRLVADGEDYYLVPTAPQVPDGALERFFYDKPQGKWSAPVSPIKREDGKTQRVLLSEEAREGMAKCKQNHKLTKQQAAKAMSDPEEFFGDVFDLSEFSERVVGLGPEVHRVVPIVKETAFRDWWDWDVILQINQVSADDVHAGSASSEAAPSDSTSGGSNEVSVKDPQVREAIKAAIEGTDPTDAKFIPNPVGEGMWENTPQLRQAIEAAELLSKSEGDDGRLKRRPRLVLQVKENLESLVFDRQSMPALVAPPTLEQPPGLVAGHALMEHQLEGYAWLRSLYGDDADVERWKGCLLADDMGLGKTLQVLAFFSWMRAEGKAGPILVVAPLALMENWQEEARRFFGSRFEPIVQVTGAEIRRRGFSDYLSYLKEQSVVLASYDTLRKHEALFARMRWQAAVFDEAQKIKNPAAQVTRVALTLNARFRLAMSGTPVENGLRELWSLYDWASPGLLDYLRQFADEFIVPLAKADPAERVALSNKLQERIGPVFCRRMKADILQDKIPPISFHDQRVVLSSEQEERYEAAMATRGESSGGSLPLLNTLFAICAHPHLRGKAALPPLEELSYPKIDRLCELLDAISAAGEKALVFANRIAVQRWLADTIEHRYGVPTPHINGSITEAKARMDIIREFSARKGFACLVLAPRAAGVGLNIVAANHVIHYTREWNPAVENQATDRAYRIGQTRPVHVHYMISTSAKGRTVEETLADLLAEKRQLMKDFVVPMGGFEDDQERLAASL